MPHKLRYRILTALLAVPWAVFSHAPAQAPAGQSPAAAVDRVKAAAEALQSTYNPGTGLFNGTGWWNSANGISALALAGGNLHAHDFDSLFENTFQAAPKRFPAFLNDFYDDEGWWALAWLDVYALRHDPRFLATAESIFNDMSGGWSGICGGGIWWKKNEHYKDAIANELFLSVAVRLALLHTGADRAKYLHWAQKEEQWFLRSGMINGQSLVNDGLDAACHNNGRTTWTYNQGVILTGLIGYNRLTHDPAALATANRIASAAAERLTDANGILHDPCEPDCGDDGVQFKGIFVRNLATLLQAVPSAKLQELIDRNANSVWEHARTRTNRFSVDWAGPPQDSGTGSLISALDAIVAPGNAIKTDADPRGTPPILSQPEHATAATNDAAND